MTGSLWDIDDNQINEVRELINSNNKYLSDPILGMELVAKILPKGRTKNDDYKSALRLRSIFSKKIWLLLKKWGSLTILPTFCTTNIHNFEKEIFIIR